MEMAQDERVTNELERVIVSPSGSLGSFTLANIKDEPNAQVCPHRLIDR